MTDPAENPLLRRSPLAVMAGLPPGTPAPQALLQVLRHLVATSGAAGAEAWRRPPPSDPAGPGLVRVAHWTDRGDSRSLDETVDELVDLDARPGVGAVASLDGESGAVTLLLVPGQQAGDDQRQLLADTAICAFSLWGLDDRRTTLSRQESHTDRLAGQLSAATRGLGTVRDTERRRVAAEIIRLSTGPLTELRGHVDELGLRIASGPPPGPEAARRLLPELDDLIEDFRVMVRGIHPVVLQTRGPKAALAEAVAGLARPVRINGSLPRRMEAELASAVYYFGSAAVQTLVRGGHREPIEVDLGRADGRFAVTVRGATRTPVVALRAAVAVEVDRFNALGGDVEVSAEEDDGRVVATLRGRLPDRLEPPARPQPGPAAGLPGRVRDLALRVTARYAAGLADEAGAAAAQALVPRLEGPVRVGVRGPAARAVQLPDLARRTPGLHLEEIHETDPPDVVLQAVLPEDGLLELRLGGPDAGGPDAGGPDAGVLVPATTWAELPAQIDREVIARADLLRARSVLVAVTDVLRRHPLPGEDGARFGYQVEQLRAQAHELVELEALARLRAGAEGLTRAQVRSAERLLGADGSAAHERLNVPASSTVDQLRAEAAEQLRPWRDTAKHAVNRRQREIGAAVVRSCERLLVGLGP